MANRYDRDQQQRGYGDRDYPRQAEQFEQQRGDQYGESYSDQDERSYRDDRSRRTTSPRGDDLRRERGYGGRDYRQDRGYDPLADYDREADMRNRARYSPETPPEATHTYFRGDDTGGVNLGGGPRSYTGGSMGDSHYSRRGYSQYDNRERGFFDKAGDEIASWFGDEDAERRREMDHRGRGPNGYQRSDERILEDACDRLTDDRGVDARNMQVSVKDSEITLDGNVNTRWEKRRAEDCVHDLSGVTHVQNNLRIAQTGMRSGNEQVNAEK